MAGLLKRILRKETLRELSAQQVLEGVYVKMFQDRAREIVFPEKYSSEVERDEMKSWGMGVRYMIYRRGKIVALEEMPWIISLGKAGQTDLNIQSDIMAIQADDPKEIRRQTRYFNSTLVFSRSSGSLNTPQTQEYDGELRGLLNGLENFVHNEAEIQELDNTPISGLVVLNSPRTYKPEIVNLLSRRLEARLQLIAEKRCGK